MLAAKIDNVGVHGMKRWIVNRILDRFARQWNYDVSYMRLMAYASPAAFRKFGAISALANHREAVPVESAHTARIVGVHAEDCGPCIQLAADTARSVGMADDQIIAVLAGDTKRMSDHVALAFEFSHALVAQRGNLDVHREAIRARWGDSGVIDLTLAVQISRIYPLVKAGMGFAEACATIQVGSTNVPPRRVFAA